MCCKSKYILQRLKPATKIMYFNEKTEIFSNFGRKSIAFIPLFSLDIWLLHSLCFLRLRILYTIIAIKTAAAELAAAGIFHSYKGNV